MSDEPRDDETAGAPSKRVLTSGGAMEAQAYATANLRDAVRPTLEMDKVQITDPRNAITSRKKRPPIPDLPAVTPAPPPVASEGPVSTRGSGVLPPPSAPPRRLAPPPMPAVTPTPPPLPVTPLPLPVTASSASDDDGADRPTLPRDDGEERVTLPTAHKSPFATPPGGVTSPSAEPAAPRRRSTLLLGIAAAAVIGLGGAWFALASRAPAGAATTRPEVAPIVTVGAATAPAAPIESAAPAPIESAAPAPTVAAAPVPTGAPAAPTVAAAPRPEAPPRTAPAPAPRPAAKPKAPAPPPASTTPAKGRLFGVED